MKTEVAFIGWIGSIGNQYTEAFMNPEIECSMYGLRYECVSCNNYRKCEQCKKNLSKDECIKLKQCKFECKYN